MTTMPPFERALRSASARDARIARARISAPFPIAAFELRMRTLFETRILAFRTRPTATTTDLPEDPNPWEAEISHPAGASADSRVEVLYDLEYPRVCTTCSGVGDKVCDVCDGSGRVRVSHGQETHTHPCERCHGAGRVPCDDCGGSGVVLAVPIAVSTLATYEERRVVVLDERESLPDEVFLALQDDVPGALTLFEEESPRVDEAMLARLADALAREDVSRVEPAITIARTQGANPDVGSARIHAQTLVTKRIPMWSVSIGGRPAHALGDAPTFYPEDVLGARLPRTYVLVAITALLLLGAVGFVLTR